ncbi:hypothetical protein HWV62_43098 [Athelia sp. TMB]|nr:hypothetical protein HWV62_43098 [Athelia sp. TMB]
MASNYEDFLGRPSGNSWSEADESALLEPYTYITSNPGKEIRGQMIDAFNHWLKVPTEKLKIITRVVSMLHSATLIPSVDDIEDDSQLRRGQPGAFTNPRKSLD